MSLAEILDRSSSYLFAPRGPNIRSSANKQQSEMTPTIPVWPSGRCAAQPEAHPHPYRARCGTASKETATLPRTGSSEAGCKALLPTCSRGPVKAKTPYLPRFSKERQERAAGASLPSFPRSGRTRPASHAIILARCWSGHAAPAEVPQGRLSHDHRSRLERAPSPPPPTTPPAQTSPAVHRFHMCRSDNQGGLALTPTRLPVPLSKAPAPHRGRRFAPAADMVAARGQARTSPRRSGGIRGASESRRRSSQAVTRCNAAAACKGQARPFRQTRERPSATPKHPRCMHTGRGIQDLIISLLCRNALSVRHPTSRWRASHLRGEAAATIESRRRCRREDNDSHVVPAVLRDAERLEELEDLPATEPPVLLPARLQGEAADEVVDALVPHGRSGRPASATHTSAIDRALLPSQPQELGTAVTMLGRPARRRFWNLQERKDRGPLL